MAYVYALGAVVATAYMVVAFVTMYTDPLSGWRVRLRMAGARLLSVGACLMLAACAAAADPCSSGFTDACQQPSNAPGSVDQTIEYPVICVDMSRDPRNCGGCFVVCPDCLEATGVFHAGACVDGQCAPPPAGCNVTDGGAS